MALFAEKLVEEWLSRQGYFTIRGTKVGVHEIDLLAIRPTTDGIECRNTEVQASVIPVSYVTKAPKEVQLKTGRAVSSAKTRDDDELREGVREWVTKKFDHPKKEKLRRLLAPGNWSREWVINAVRHQRKIELLRETDITIRRLPSIVAELKGRDFLLDGAAGTPLADLVLLLPRQLCAMPNPSLQGTLGLANNSAISHTW
ncbi:hypothetical protein [Rugosibacter aromaticivorans]|uniref:hypothetical protein n=1 Tax=Rugosibacter aromaticivorans TaxID=1565605 RepID=UPI00192A1C0C|nr:hypothetical protein [Rugosibacter aromaticivorans]